MDKGWVALKRAVYNNKFRNTVIQKVFITFSRRTYFLAAVFLAAGFLALAAGFLAAGFLALVAGFFAAWVFSSLGVHCRKVNSKATEMLQMTRNEMISANSLVQQVVSW